MIIVSLVILIFLWHIPSAIVPILTIPISVLLAFIPLYYMGVTVNIMSLAGIAISIGVLVDGAIVEVENAYNKLHHWEAGRRKGDFHEVRLEALQGGRAVGLLLAAGHRGRVPPGLRPGRPGRPAVQAARLSRRTWRWRSPRSSPSPSTRRCGCCSRAWTRSPSSRGSWRGSRRKTLVGTYYAEEKHPISRVLFRGLRAGVPLRAALPEGGDRHGAGAGRGQRSRSTSSSARSSCRRSTRARSSTCRRPCPGISVAAGAGAAGDRRTGCSSAFPEVERVFGKAGRAETSTDPAPFSMMETTVVLKPEAQWEREAALVLVLGARIGSSRVLRPIWPDRISWDELVDEMDRALQIPGVTNAWTMPIKARIDMLTTGVRTPVGIKIFGADLAEIERIGEQLEGIVREIPGTRSVFAERVTGGYFVDFVPRRDQLARYGLTIDAAAGRDHERHRRRERHHHHRGARALPGQRALPARAARRRRPAASACSCRRRRARRCRSPSSPTSSCVQGPAMIRDENGFLAGYVYVDIAGRDIGGYVEEAKKVVAREARAAAGLRPAVERPVREHDPRPRAAQGRRADHAGADLPAALREHRVGLQGGGRHARGAVLGDRRDLALPPPRLQRLDRGLGRDDRAARPRRRDRRVHAAVPRPLLRRRQEARPAADRSPTSTRRSSTARSSGCGPR